MHFLITAGPTREYLDSVRFLTNASSGKMGYACARAALRRGHRVTLVSGPVSLKPPQHAQLVSVVSAIDIDRAVTEHFTHCDCLIMTAAVADYTPRRKSSHKLAKTQGPLLLELKRTPDILARMGRRKKHQVLIGFALQDRAPRQNAARKLRQKNLDAIVLNAPSALAANAAHVELLLPDADWQSWPNLSKNQLASRLIRLAERLHLPPTP